MIDRLTRRVLESYILVLLELYKRLTGYPFDRSAAIERRWGVRKK